MDVYLYGNVYKNCALVSLRVTQRDEGDWFGFFIFSGRGGVRYPLNAINVSELFGKVLDVEEIVLELGSSVEIRSRRREWRADECQSE